MAGRTSRPKLMGEPRPMTREDMALSLAPARRATVSTTAIRDYHHRIARLAAAGLRLWEIAERSGYTSARVSTILASPSVQELVAYYRDKVTAAWQEEVIDEYSMALRTKKMALAQRLERLEAADMGDIEPIPLRDLATIIADTEDRYGVMKKTGNVNVNADFAKELEAELARAIDRSGKVIEVTTDEGKLRRRV